MAGDYHFLTVWRVTGAVHEVMAVLGDADALPQWWPSVYLSVVEVKDAGPDEQARSSTFTPRAGFRTRCGGR